MLILEDSYKVENELNDDCKKEMLLLFDEIEYIEEQEVETNIEINKILY
ncbi:Uncharacterised protein [Staphylococcus epidermidis]|nr:hypothetical protein [Staphylococcus epidermidis]SUM53516.1 Uncharacterised protein [Staphylococcus epidermidis]SUM53523.1 Uncharacterised protein [Staphylococcus epidermidis]